MWLTWVGEFVLRTTAVRVRSNSSYVWTKGPGSLRRLKEKGSRGRGGGNKHLYPVEHGSSSGDVNGWNFTGLTRSSGLVMKRNTGVPNEAPTEGWG